MIFHKSLFLCFIIILFIFGSVSSAPKRRKLNAKQLQAVKAMINNQMLEGDILVRTKGNKPKTPKKFGKNGFRNAVSSEEYLWPNGIIPYYIDDSVSDQKELIQKGMKQIEKYTCIRFREKTNEDKFHLKIFKGKG